MAKDIYVKNTGSNSNSGLVMANPVQTRAHALGLAVPGDRILVYGGDLFYGEHVQNKSGILWDVYGLSQKPVFSGFITLTGWTNQGGGIWSKTEPSLGTTLRKVTIDGEKYAKGRFPKFDSTTHGFVNISSGTTSSLSATAVSSMPNFVGGEIVIKSQAYSLNIVNITGQSGSTLNFSGTVDYGGARANYGFFVQNHINTLTEFGEWSYNGGTRTISMYFGSENPNSYTIKASATPNLVTVSGNPSDVKFDNFIIEGSNLEAFLLTNSSAFSIYNSEIRQTGLDGIFANSHQYMDVYNTYFHDINNNAYYLGQNTDYAMARRCTVDQTGMDHGMLKGGLGCGIGIHLPWFNSLAERNLVTNCGQTGIRYEKAYTQCNYNHVHHTGSRFGDVGAVYNWNGSTNDDKQPGMRCIGNVIHSLVRANQGTPYGSQYLTHGIYQDDHTSGAPDDLHEIRDNIVYDVEGVGIFLHNSESFDIQGNTVFNSRHGLQISSDSVVPGTSTPGGERMEDLHFRNNIMVAKTADQNAIFIFSNMNDIPGMVNSVSDWDNNVLARPILDTTPIRIQAASNTTYNDIEDWTGMYGWDANSTASPVTITDVEQFRIEANPDDTPKTVDLSDGTYVDMHGVVQQSIIELQPHSGILLIRTSEIPPEPTNPTVQFTNIVEGSRIIYPNPLTVQATVAASTPITKVEFFQGAVLVDTVTESPWETTFVPDPGDHFIQAKATDSDDLVGFSDSVAIEVYDFEDHVKINTGTSSDVIYGGEIFRGDRYFLDTYTPGALEDNVSPVTTEPLFLSGRAASVLWYRIPVPNGRKTVNLMFNEPWFGVHVEGGPGKRVFDININGQLVKQAFDIFVENNNQNTVLTFEDIDVTDGEVYVLLNNSNNKANISGIEIVPFEEPEVYYVLTVRENPTEWGTAIDLTNGGPYLPGTQVNLQAVANPDTVFARWSRDGVTLSTNTNYIYTTRAQNDTVLGEFTPKKYMLTLQTNGSGMVSPAPAEYFQGQPVAISATASSGWQFVNWTKNGVPVSSSASFTYTKLSEDEVLVANFTQTANRTLTVQVNPVGGGTTNITSQQHTAGQVINLVATANPGFSFVVWVKNGVEISTDASFAYTTTNQNETVSAYFIADTVYYTLTVNSNPVEGGTTNVTSVQHEEYEVVPLFATPNTGYIFVNWAKNGVNISTNPELNYTAGPLNETITANFARLEYTVTINSAVGGTAEVVTLPPYYEGDTVQVKATLGAGFYFVEWIMFIPPSTGTVGAGQPTYTFTMPQGNVEFTPVFEEVPLETYALSVVASPEEGGIAMDITGGNPYLAGSSVSLEAEAFDGWRFKHWLRGVTVLSTSATYNYSTRAQDDTVLAVFEEIPPVMYSVNAIADFGGTTTGSGEYEEGSEASLTAAASPGLQFMGWFKDGIKITEQNPYIFSVWEDTTVTAMFAPLYTLVVNSNTGGTVTGGGVFVEFDSVSAFATPAMGYRFAGWFENGSKIFDERLYTFPIASDRVLLAQFAPLNFFVVAPSAGDGGTVSGGGVYFEGDTATVTATPDEGTSFIRWEKDGLAVSGEAVYSFTVTEDANLVAIFGPKVKYRCDFRNHFNDLCRVDITFEGYSGETILLRSSESNGCTIEREVSEDPYDPIVVTKARTTLIQEEHNPIDVRELQEAEDREFVLSFYIEGELNFTGFVVPDGIQQIFQSPPYDVTISATDGLRLLSGIPYSHDNLPGGRNPMNYFRQILFDNLGLPLPIKWVNTLTNDNWPDEDVFTGSVRWAPRGEGFTDYAGTVKYGLYILENMLKSMQCRIFQDKGHWVIWRINDVVSGQFSYKGIQATLGEWEVTESQVDINRTVGGIRDGYDYSFIEEDAYVTSKKALKTVRVVYEHEQRDNILPNGSMDLVNGIFDAPLYWGITNGTTPTVQSVPSLYADRGYAVEVNNDWFQTQDSIFSLAPNKLPIDSDVLYGSFNFSFTFSILSGVYLDPDGFIVWDSTPFPLRITYNAGGKTYYLNEFGYWTEQNGWIQLRVENLKIGDVASIDFRAKQPNIILPVPTQSPIGRTDTPYLTIELGIPEHRRIIFDDITFSVDNANDIYEAVSSLAGNSASESYDLKISSSHNGFHLSNYMTNFDKAGEEKFFSDDKLSAATLTEMTAHAIVRNRYKPSILFEGSLSSRKYSYGEIYNVMLLDGKKLLPLKSSWNTETNTVKLTATEVRDDGTGIYVRHYASNDNTKQSYGQQ